MTIFARYRLAAAELESTLHRPLTGGPGQGERAVVAAMNAGKIEEARNLLALSPQIGADFRAVVEDLMRRALARAAQSKTWSIRVELPVWDHYAQRARLAQRPVTEELALAVQRDYQAAQEAANPRAALEDTIRQHQATLAGITGQVQQLLTRLGAVQDLAARLGRVEAAVTRR